MLKIDDRLEDCYRIVGRIGTGGMAEVYEASDYVSRRTVAIKIIREELLDDQVQLDRFNNEAKICAIMNHPNIIKVYSRGEFEDRPYIAYELIKGDTLDDQIRKYTHFSLRESCSMMKQILDAVYYIHNHQVIHRDIKPSNVFVLNDGTLKIGDFGISYDLTSPKTQRKGVVGSIQYMAPELCQGSAPTIQTDIYALGMTFFELLTGQTPFQEGSAKDIAKQHVSKSIPSVHGYVPELNKNVDFVINKACAKNPNKRYKDCMEFKADIQKLLDNKENFEERRNVFKRFFGLK